MEIWKHILSLIVTNLDDTEARCLLDDMRRISRADLTDDKCGFEFTLDAYDRPEYKGQRPYSVELKMSDADGAVLHAIAFKDQNDKLLSLEIIRYEDGKIISPDISSIEILN